MRASGYPSRLIVHNDIPNREEFESLGVSHLITVHHLDVCGKKEGDDPLSIPSVAELKGTCDAVSTATIFNEMSPKNVGAYCDSW